MQNYRLKTEVFVGDGCPVRQSSGFLDSSLLSPVIPYIWTSLPILPWSYLDYWRFSNRKKKAKPGRMPRMRASYRPKRKETQPESSVPSVVPSSVPSVVPSSVQPAPSFASSMKQGFGFGLGSSLAHSMIGSMFRGSPPNCQSIQKEYDLCFVDSECSTERRNKLFTDLQQCTK